MQAEYEIICSQSGTAHMVNPKPTFPGAGRGFPDRTQTLCEMHIRSADGALPSGKACEFCARQAQLIEVRSREKGEI